MREFFRSWKRKIGVLMLVMACVLTAGWLRSLSGLDIIGTPILNQIAIGIESKGSYIGLLIAEAPNGSVGHPVWHRYTSAQIDGWVRSSPQAVVEVHPLGMIHIGFAESPIAFSRNCLVPYWTVTLPIALISAWCLLSKSRAKPATNTESADA
jgi:hypothetical protein